MSLFDRVRGLWADGSSAAPSNVKELVRREFGLSIRNPQFYQEALTHSSMLDGDTTGRRSNERLEFLGDVALDLSVATEVFSEFPEDQEGGLTQRKSKVVNRKTLNLLGERMGLPALIEAKMRREDIRDAIVGNAVEALIGAVYLDHGYKKTSRAVVRLLKRHGAYDKVHSKEDFKSQLHKWASKQRRHLDFKVISEGGEGDSVYEVAAVVSGKELGRGTGNSKKEAEQMASRHAWKRVYTASKSKGKKPAQLEDSRASDKAEGSGQQSASEKDARSSSRSRSASSRSRSASSRRRRSPKPSGEEKAEGVTQKSTQKSAQRAAEKSGQKQGQKTPQSEEKSNRSSNNRRRRPPRKAGDKGNAPKSENS